MDRETALSDLKSPNARIRLTAARYLVRSATGEDLPVLDAAAQTETVAWIRSALSQAIEQAQAPVAEHGFPSEAEPFDDADEAYASAVVQVTSELLHELEPLVGVLRLRLITEWTGFENTKSESALDQIESFLTALRELNAAAQVSALEDLSIKGAVEQVVAETPQQVDHMIATSGPDIQVSSNKGMLQLIVRNGVRNALEATHPESDKRIVVTWGTSGEGGFFVSVIDNGPGPPAGAELHAFELGTSTKRGHLGMGLAVAKRAAESLGGTLTLRPGKSGGAVLRFGSTRTGP